MSSAFFRIHAGSRQTPHQVAGMLHFIHSRQSNEFLHFADFSKILESGNCLVIGEVETSAINLANFSWSYT